VQVQCHAPSQGAAMLSPETLEQYRQMTLGERLDLTLRLIRESTFYMLSGPQDVVSRRFQLLRRENDLRNENMLRAFARSRENGDQ
jgi:hypothetical protein